MLIIGSQKNVTIIGTYTSRMRFFRVNYLPRELGVLFPRLSNSDPDLAGPATLQVVVQARPRWPAGDVRGCCLNLDQSTRMKHPSWNRLFHLNSFESFVSPVVFQEPKNETRVPVIWVICSIFVGGFGHHPWGPEPFHLVLVGTRDAKPDLISWDWTDWTFKHQSWDSKHTKFVAFIAIPPRVPHNEPWGLEPDGENQRWTPDLPDPVHCHRVLIHQEITTNLKICTLPCIAIHCPIILVFWIIRMYFATQTIPNMRFCKNDDWHILILIFRVKQSSLLPTCIYIPSSNWFIHPASCLVQLPFLSLAHRVATYWGTLRHTHIYI